MRASPAPQVARRLALLLGDMRSPSSILVPFGSRRARPSARIWVCAGKLALIRQKRGRETARVAAKALLGTPTNAGMESPPFMAFLGPSREGPIARHFAGDCVDRYMRFCRIRASSMGPIPIRIKPWSAISEQIDVIPAQVFVLQHQRQAFQSMRSSATALALCLRVRCGFDATEYEFGFSTS